MEVVSPALWLCPVVFYRAQFLPSVVLLVVTTTVEWPPDPCEDDAGEESAEVCLPGDLWCGDGDEGVDSEQDEDSAHVGVEGAGEDDEGAEESEDGV